MASRIGAAKLIEAYHQEQVNLMRHCLDVSAVSVLIVVSAASITGAAEFHVNGQTFTVPDGFEVLPIAGPPLVDRPISVDFDEDGHLYVTESSGSNDDVEVQVKMRRDGIRNECCDYTGR